MPTVLRHQVTLPTASQLPRDYIMNTWHSISVDIDPVDDANLFRDRLMDFYLTIDAFMSGRLSSDIHIDSYDLSDAMPRTPIAEFTSSLSVGTGDGLPNEVAICLSYRGPSASGVIAARHRGRIFLGPWDVMVVDQGTGDTIVEASVRNGISNAAETLAQGAVSDGGPWCVYSPTTNATQSLINSAFAVDNGWVDDAFDTIRSRGGTAANRSTWSI